jgi:hypothetical protein
MTLPSKLCAGLAETGHVGSAAHGMCELSKRLKGLRPYVMDHWIATTVWRGPTGEFSCQSRRWVVERHGVPLAQDLPGTRDYIH